jgi:spermidine/putrescine transport system ATP-binding protein
MAPGDLPVPAEGASARPLLRAAGLCKTYGAVQAVRGVDFTLPAQGYVTLLGPSGCGKTTILRLIGGFERASSGLLELDGVSLLDVPANRRPINTVFQSYALFPHLSVEQNVAFGLTLRRRGRAQIAERVGRALAMVQMQAMRDRRPRQLSGGQQQRVALARAIVNEPRLLLLDEPLSALDQRLRKDMQVELKDLQRRLNMAFLHVTHDQEEAFALSDWIVVMRDGRIEQQGTPVAVYHQPASAYVADFIGGANLLAGQVVDVRGGRATLATALGIFEAGCAATVALGQPASLCLRAEHVRPVAAGGIAARVAHVVFKGAEWLVAVETEDGNRLDMLLRHQPPAPPGATLQVTFDPDAAWIVDGIIQAAA